MKCKLVKLRSLSGKRASIYSVILNDETETLLDKFIRENQNLFLSEIQDILGRLRTIGSRTGARSQFFKEFEGRPGDGVSALYDIPGSKLRLYCIRFGTEIVILGNGGPKSKTIRAFQEDTRLTEKNYFLRWLSEQISARIAAKEITFSGSYLDFIGDLEFDDGK